VSEDGDAPVTQSRDTSPEIEAMQVARWRAMEPWEKVALVSEMHRFADALGRTGIVHRHPHGSTDELRLRLAALRLGRELMVEHYDWNPDERGW
jgi:hypothetical protein